MAIGGTVKAWAARMKRDGVTLWFAGKHPRTPWYAKALGVSVVACALRPIDLIPDFIPVLGYVNDALLLPGLILLAVQAPAARCPRAMPCRRDAWMLTEGRTPTSRAGAILVVLLRIGIGVAARLWLRSRA